MLHGHSSIRTFHSSLSEREWPILLFVALLLLSAPVVTGRVYDKFLPIFFRINQLNILDYTSRAFANSHLNAVAGDLNNSARGYELSPSHDSHCATHPCVSL